SIKVRTSTVTGATSGYLPMGEFAAEMAPISEMSRAITIANLGLSMNILNMSATELLEIVRILRP
ncbi:hypothetical protein MRS74_23910, partial [Marinobacterium sp. OS208]